MLVIYGSAVRESQSDMSAFLSGRAADQAAAAAGEGVRVCLCAASDAADAAGPAPTAGHEGVDIRLLSPVADSAADCLGAEARVLLLNVDLPFDFIMSVASAARARNVPVMLHLSEFPQWLDMPRLHALLGRTDTLVLRASELDRAVSLLGEDMLGECTSPAEKSSALAYWASITVISTHGSEGALYAQGENPAQRFIAPTMELFDAPKAQNLFCATLAAAIHEGDAFDQAIPHAIAAASRSGDAVVPGA